MGSFSKFGQLEFQVHSWLINSILGRITQWADAVGKVSVSVPSSWPLSRFIVLSSFPMTRSSLESVVSEHGRNQALGSESGSPRPAARRGSSRTGLWHLLRIPFQWSWASGCARLKPGFEGSGSAGTGLKEAILCVSTSGQATLCHSPH